MYDKKHRALPQTDRMNVMTQNFSVPVEQFNLRGNVVLVEPYGCGHINRTFRVVTDTDNWYLFQRVNTDIFPNIVGLMDNIQLVTRHIREKIKPESVDPDRECMVIVHTKDGEPFARLDDGCWRCFVFIRDTVTLQAVNQPKDFYLSAVAFGRFQQQLQDFDASQLCEVIPNFHNTPWRLQNLLQAEQADTMDRVKEVQKELDFVHERAGFCHLLQDAIEDGSLPLKVTHNDTKLNNLLFDEKTMQPICVVDLDTVMPGSALFDFGDSIRFGAATAAEDEKDLSKVECSLELFEAYVKGWMESCGDSMTKKEISLLPAAARMMTLECGIRFLTDYLQGDTYFATHYYGQNLDRCRTQFKLVADMEKKEAQMHAIVEKYAHG